jgi:Histidine kinase-, DNA gyrase B-, and HSP90-like ATPase.
MGQKNIALIGEDIEEVTVNYDKSLLELVWNNLISNAVKFTDEGGTITVSLKKKAVAPCLRYAIPDAA